MEGIGPVTLPRIRDWLSHSRVTVKPVIDLNNQTPVDSYEIPDRIREAIHLIESGRLLPLRHLHQPDPGHRPHHPLPATRSHDHRRGWPTRPDSSREPRTDGPDATTAPKPSPTGTSNKSGPACSPGEPPHGHHYLVDHTGTTKAQPWPNAA